MGGAGPARGNGLTRVGAGPAAPCRRHPGAAGGLKLSWASAREGPPRPAPKTPTTSALASTSVFPEHRSSLTTLGPCARSRGVERDARARDTKASPSPAPRPLVLGQVSPCEPVGAPGPDVIPDAPTQASPGVLDTGGGPPRPLEMLPRGVGHAAPQASALARYHSKHPWRGTQEGGDREPNQDPGARVPVGGGPLQDREGARKRPPAALSQPTTSIGQ